MDFRNEPIVYKDGDWDDSGYREAPIPEETNPDLLVVANERLKCFRIYYNNGWDKSDLILLRAPVVNSLELVNKILQPYGLEMLVLDGFRSVYTQAMGWRDTLRRIIKGRDPESLSALELLKFGLQADEIFSYAQVSKKNTFHRLVDNCLSDGPLLFDFALANEQLRLEKTPREMAALYITFLVNFGKVPSIPLDTAAHTSHGNGGTEDSRLLDISTGREVCLGTPYDWTDTRLCSVDSFEYEDKFELWQQAQLELSKMNSYLAGCGITEKVTPDDFHRVRDLRRILYWATEQVGAGRYSQEFWHRTYGNEDGIGNSCHAMSKKLFGPDGQPLVVWGNKAAHEMAVKITG